MLFINDDCNQTLCSYYTRTVIPSPDQIFQGKMVRADHYFWNFGPPDQYFHWTKISVTGLFIYNHCLMYVLCILRLLWKKGSLKRLHPHTPHHSHITTHTHTTQLPSHSHPPHSVVHTHTPTHTFTHITSLSHNNATTVPFLLKFFQ